MSNYTKGMPEISENIHIEKGLLIKKPKPPELRTVSKGAKFGRRDTPVFLFVIALLLVFAIMVLSNLGCTYLPKSNNTNTIGGTVEKAKFCSVNGEKSIKIKFLEQIRTFTFSVDEVIDFNALKWKRVLIRYRVLQAAPGLVRWEIVEVIVL